MAREALAVVRADDGDGDGRERADVIARRRLERFMTLLVDALAIDDVAERLGRAGIRVSIVLDDLPDTVVSLLLHESPARVVFGTPQPPDIRLWMTSADLEAVLHRKDHLPMQVIAGTVRFEGCVRKLLRVLPIVTGAVETVLAERTTRDAAAPSA